MYHFIRGFSVKIWSGPGREKLFESHGMSIFEVILGPSLVQYGKVLLDAH